MDFYLECPWINEPLAWPGFVEEIPELLVADNPEGVRECVGVNLESDKGDKGEFVLIGDRDVCILLLIDRPEFSLGGELVLWGGALIIIFGSEPL